MQKHGGQGKRDVPVKNIPSVSDIGLTRKEIHEARQIRDAERRDPASLRSRTAQDIIEIGKELIAVREKFSARGDGFNDWIDANFSMHKSTATRFMQVATTYGNRVHRELETSILYELAKTNTPEEVRTEVAERAAAGEAVTVAQVGVAPNRAAPLCGKLNNRPGRLARIAGSA